MGRFLAGVASALLLVAAGLFFWQGQESSNAATPFPSMPDATPQSLAELPPAIEAPAASKEQKRFRRYDKDRNGAISRDEYLASRRKAYARLDTNGDGVISFNEYAVKASTKFVGADRDRSGALSAPEFATTRPVRKSRPKPDCPQPRARVQPESSANDDDA